MPPLITIVARLSDGLPLVVSFANTGGEDLTLQKQQAKEILRNLNSNGRPVSKMSISTSNLKVFHYLVQSNICILTLTEQAYPKRLAFLYLSEVADAFLEFLSQQHTQQQSSSSSSSSLSGDGDCHRMIETVARPYAFIQADPILQRKQREFMDPKSSVNCQKLNQDLSDIHSIMRQNISQVLDRGEKLEQVSQISQNLMSESKKFKWGAKKLSWWAKVNAYAPVAAMGSFVMLVLYWKFFR
jgi:vesicle transport protein SEC22